MKQKLHYDHVIIAAAIVIGFVSGLGPLNDNSLLVHLRTGMSIVNTHHVPQSDPYSFSATGTHWVDESWLAEVIYGLAIKLGSAHLLQIFNGIIYAATAGVIAKMCRTNNPIRTFLVAVIALGVGLAGWSARPTEFGLLFFAFSVFIVVNRKSFWWLAIIGLLWVNIHGTWPLAIAFIVANGVGARLDGDAWQAQLKYVAALVGGVLVGGLLSPAGPDVLTFPLMGFGDRAAIFKGIVEWMSPNFTDPAILGSRVVLVALLCSIGILARSKQKWAVVLPTLAMLAAALLGQRNLPFLGAALAPFLAASLARPFAPAEPDTRRLIVIGTTVLLVFGALYGAANWGTSPYKFKPYPVAAVDWLEQNHMVGAGHHIAAPDLVGCYMIYRYGIGAQVFIDDRYDMYPIAVAQDSRALLGLPGDLPAILSRYDFESVLYQRDTALAQYLSIDPQWKQVWSDKTWVIFQRA